MNVRFATPADIPACNAFHNRTYQKHRTQAQWEWEFDPKRTPLPYVVVEENGEILGTQALIPLKMIDGEGVFWTAKSEETLLDPALRGKDMFRKMYDLLFAYAKEHGLEVIWGFTSANKAFEKVGFEVPGRTGQVFLPCHPAALKALTDMDPKSPKGRALGLGLRAASVVSRVRGALAAAKPPAGITLKVLTEAPEEAGEVCRRFIAHWGGTTLLRDAGYLQWRFFDNPHVAATVVGAYEGDRLVGWVAYALDDDSMGYVVDLMVAPPEPDRARMERITAALLQSAVSALRKTGALGIRAWRLNDHPFDALLTRVAQRLGFYRIRRGEPVVLYFVGERRASMRSFDGWFITRAFTEGVSG